MNAHVTVLNISKLEN